MDPLRVVVTDSEGYGSTGQSSRGADKTHGQNDSSEKAESDNSGERKDSNSESPRDVQAGVTQNRTAQEGVAEGTRDSAVGDPHSTTLQTCCPEEPEVHSHVVLRSGSSPSASALLRDSDFRRKLLRTTLVDAAYLGVTLNLGMLGPSLLDLETRARTTTSRISTVFTYRALLGLVASLTMGTVLDRLDRNLVVCVMLFADVLFVAAAPWCTSLVPMLSLLAPPEFFNCVIGMGTHLLCIGIWRNDAGPSLQSLNLMATVGYTLAPLLCKPFVSSAAVQRSGMELRNATVGAVQVAIMDVEDTAFGATLGSISYSLHENFSTVQPPQSDASKIQYAYLIVAIYDLVVGILLLTLFVKDGCRFRAKEDGEEKGKEGEDEHKSTRGFEIKISILFFVFNVFYGGIEVGYAGLLMTFAVKYLGWSKTQGTDVTAVLQGSNAAITAVAVIIAKYVKPNHMLAASISMVTTSMLLLSVLAPRFPVSLWLSTAGLGVGYATIMPSSYTWVNGFMRVSGTFSSAYWSGFFTGFMVVPALSGFLFQTVHPMCLPYVTLGCGVGMLCVFLIISVLAHKKTSADSTA